MSVMGCFGIVFELKLSAMGRFTELLRCWLWG